MGNNWGDGISSSENKNYDYLLRKKAGVYIANSVSVDDSENTKRTKSQTTGKYKDVILLKMKEYNERLRVVAKEEGKKHHTLAREFIVAGIKRLEKRHKKEKFIDKQYDI